MDSKSFMIWLKGFTEACNDLTATPKQWDRIKEVLNDVQDYNDNPGLDEEIDDWHPGPNTNLFPPNGTSPSFVCNDRLTGTINIQSGDITFTSSSNSTSTTYFPTGTNITYTTKHQLND